MLYLELSELDKRLMCFLLVVLLHRMAIDRKTNHDCNIPKPNTHPGGIQGGSAGCWYKWNQDLHPSKKNKSR